MFSTAYLRFAMVNRRFLAFGFVMAFASSFGQTYFIGVFGPSIQAEFGLSHTAWGSIYMVGTLASAMVLPWTGMQIDRLDLRHYAVAVCLSLIVACGFMSVVAGVTTLAVGVFLLRQAGQGLMSHVAITSMVRYFDAGRGRAVAIATLGFAAGEAFWPLLGVLAVAAIGWRWSYGGIAVMLALVLIPTALGLLRGHQERHQAHLARLADPIGRSETEIRSRTRSEVVRELRFYLLLPGIMAPPIVVTAMFFHHLNVADAKGWSHAWMTGSYVAYAGAVVLTSLGSGPLIDRLGAVRIVPFMLIPLVLAMVVITVSDRAWIVWPYLCLLGINVGISHTAVSTMWAEIYGVAHLGAIKSLASAVSVLASALGPVIMGGLMDQGLATDHVCLIFAGYAVIGAAMLASALKRKPLAAS